MDVNNPDGAGAYDAEEDDEVDSAIGDSDSGSTFLTSIASSIRRFRHENGRTYHAYKDGSFPYPNDEPELDRLDLQHYQFDLTLDGNLFLAPIDEPPQQVLDIGTGTGIWAIDFADRYPSARVIGNDLSPIQPAFVPPNLEFEIDDANAEWTYHSQFDFIHCRQHHCAIEERNLIRQGLEHLRPGGWLELTELAYPIACDDNSYTPDCALAQWSNLIMDATSRIGQSVTKPKQYAKWMRETGFVNVTEVVYKWPTNTWPKDRKTKMLGRVCHENIMSGLHGFTVGLATRVLGRDVAEIEVLLAGVRNDLRNRDIHAYWPLYVVYGQKPKF